MNKYKYLILLTMLFLPVSSGAETFKLDRMEVENMSQYNDFCNEIVGKELGEFRKMTDQEWEQLMTPKSIYEELSNFLDRDAQKLETDRVNLENLSVLAQYEDLHNNKQKFSSLIKLLKQENAEKIEKNKAARNKLNE